jgi:hypothetical protein
MWGFACVVFRVAHFTNDLFRGYVVCYLSFWGLCWGSFAADLSFDNLCLESVVCDLSFGIVQSGFAVLDLPCCPVRVASLVGEFFIWN